VGHTLRRRADGPPAAAPTTLWTTRRPRLVDVGPEAFATTPLDALLPGLVRETCGGGGVGHGFASLDTSKRWDDVQSFLDALVSEGKAKVTSTVRARRGAPEAGPLTLTTYSILADGNADVAPSTSHRAMLRAKRQALHRTMHKLDKRGRVAVAYELPPPGAVPDVIAAARAACADSAGARRAPGVGPLRGALQGGAAVTQRRQRKKSDASKAFTYGSGPSCSDVRAAARHVALGAVQLDFRRDAFVTHVAVSGKPHDSYPVDCDEGDGHSRASKHVALEGTESVCDRFDVSALMCKEWVSLAEFAGPADCHSEAPRPLALVDAATVSDGGLRGVKCKALRFRHVSGRGQKPAFKVGAYGVELPGKQEGRRTRGAAAASDADAVEYVLRTDALPENDARGRILRKYGVQSCFAKDYYHSRFFGNRRRAWRAEAKKQQSESEA